MKKSQTRVLWEDKSLPDADASTRSDQSNRSRKRSGSDKAGSWASSTKRLKSARGANWVRNCRTKTAISQKQQLHITGRVLKKKAHKWMGFISPHVKTRATWLTTSELAHHAPSVVRRSNRVKLTQPVADICFERRVTSRKHVLKQSSDHKYYLGDQLRCGHVDRKHLK